MSGDAAAVGRGAASRAPTPRPPGLGSSTRRAALARIAALAAGALPAYGVAAQDPRAALVATAARDWLALVDAGDLAAARASAAARFRKASTEAAWSAALARQRGPRGSMQQRALVRTRFEKALRGQPEGDYAILLFRTVFEKQAGTAEAVTLEREPDGIWRVVGYSIR